MSSYWGIWESLAWIAEKTGLRRLPSYSDYMQPAVVWDEEQKRYRYIDDMPEAKVLEIQLNKPNE